MMELWSSADDSQQVTDDRNSVQRQIDTRSTPEVISEQKATIQQNVEDVDFSPGSLDRRRCDDAPVDLRISLTRSAAINERTSVAEPQAEIVTRNWDRRDADLIGCGHRQIGQTLRGYGKQVSPATAKVRLAT
jgi:hypothetical protein